MVVLVILENKYMNFFVKSFIFFSLFFSAFVAIAQSDTTFILDDDDIMFRYNLFEADKHFLNENYDLALDYYMLCLNHDKNNAFVLYRLAGIYACKNLYSLSEKYIDLCLQNDSTNIWYLYLAGSIHLDYENYDKAESIFKKLITLDDDEIGFYMGLADVYIKSNNFKKIISSYDLIEKKFGFFEHLLIQKMNLYLHANEKKKAKNEIDKLIANFPDNPANFRILADFYYKNGQVDKAIAIYNQLIADNKNDGFSYLGLVYCYSFLRDSEKVNLSIKNVLSSTEVTCDIKYNLLLGFFEDKESNLVTDEQLFKHVETLLMYHPDDPYVNGLYGKLQVANGNVEVARVAFLNVIKYDKSRFAIWNTLLSIELFLQNWESLFELSGKAIETFPNISSFYYYRGIGAMALKRYGDAKKTLDLGIQLVDDDDIDIKFAFYSHLGDVNFELGNKVDAFICYENAYSIDSTDLSLLNNYSYYLSLESKELDKAKLMSQKTILAQPDNGTFLDTYAWVLFKMKEYDEALVYISRAVQVSSPSDVVLEHYGDILYFNGLIDSAVEQWKRAVNYGNGSGLLHVKINEKKYIE